MMPGQGEAGGTGRPPPGEPSGRERVLAAIEHRTLDRIPIDYWATASVSERLIERLGLLDQEALLQRLGVDLRYVMGPSFAAGQQRRQLEGDLTVDHWGVVRRPITVEGVDRAGRSWSWSYQHVDESPLERAESVGEIEAHPWPSADQWRYDGVLEECSVVRRRGLAVVNGGDRLDRTAQLKPATYLRGMERFLIDLVRTPAIAECILERVVDYYLAYNERVFTAAEGEIDLFFMGDDMGTQESLILGPELYRRFFKRNFRRFNDLAHRFGIRTMYHSCGNVTALIPDFIDCGLDVLQSLQPAAMDLPALKREYGAHLAFQGGVDIQRTMPKGSPEDVREEVRRLAETLGSGGGYIFGTAHNLLPDVPTENILALFEAYAEYGAY